MNFNFYCLMIINLTEHIKIINIVVINNKKLLNDVYSHILYNCFLVKKGNFSFLK